MICTFLSQVKIGFVLGTWISDPRLREGRRPTLSSRAPSVCTSKLVIASWNFSRFTIVWIFCPAWVLYLPINPLEYLLNMLLTIHGAIFSLLALVHNEDYQDFVPWWRELPACYTEDRKSHDGLSASPLSVVGSADTAFEHTQLSSLW
jgi:hypothetical protein